MPAELVFLGPLLLSDQEVSEGAVLVTDGQITYAGDARHAPDASADAEVIRARDAWIAAGFIDIHVHGTHGDDVMTSGAEGVLRMARHFLAYGVTGWLPTTLSAPHDEILHAIHEIRKAADLQQQEGVGARILGIHVEGPYINPRRCGAQPLEGIRLPHTGEVRELLEAGDGLVRKMTLASEVEGGLELVRLLVREGVSASLGHSDATLAEVEEAIVAGATEATHLFNQMSPFHHREPGLVGAALSDPALVAEIILDGIHVHPLAARVALHALKAKGRDRCALITDGIAATGLPDGMHHLGRHEVNVREGRCTLPDGTLAGSVLTMNRAVRHAARYAGLPAWEAVRMASHVPATLCGVADRKGSLAAGKDADVILLDRDFHVQGVWIEGRREWSAGAGE